MPCLVTVATGVKFSGSVYSWKKITAIDVTVKVLTRFDTEIMRSSSIYDKKRITFWMLCLQKNK